MLAGIFITGGWDALMNPHPKAQVASDVAPRVADRTPGLGDLDTEALVRLNGAVQVGAGVLLALGRLPRPSALALAGSIVPTTLAAHRFWEHDDRAQRGQQRIHFLKNLGLLGGLLIAALDTEGRPGLGWRAGHTARHARAAAGRSRRRARLAARAATARLRR